MVACLDLHLRGLDPLVNDKNDKAPTGAFFTPQRHRYRWSIFIPAARVCSVPRLRYLRDVPHNNNNNRRIPTGWVVPEQRDGRG